MTAKAWKNLAVLKDKIAPLHMRDMFAADRQRFARYSAEAAGVFLDYSKNRIDDDVMAGLFALARAAEVEAKRDSMFAGEPINRTENRSVLHVALRAQSAFAIAGQDVMAEVLAERARCFAFAEEIRAAQFTDIVNIGIGGSDLGPAMAVQALAPFCKQGLRFHFVSNVDGAHLADCLQHLNPARTLFIISSKTFTTMETMMNAHSARNWVKAALGEEKVGAHFAAVSTNLAATETFGIAADRVFRFWDWVGGRYSVWSAIGLSLMIAIGPENFRQFLAGAQEMDAHFRSSPLEKNLPVLMGLIGIWNRNFLGFATQAILPYDQRLTRLPAFLQQTDMESNGKRVRMDGSLVDHATGPIVWGEPGTNGQHAFYQLMHQGSDTIPADFLIAAEPIAADREHHLALTANCLAQTEALMRGRTLQEALAQGASAELAPHKVFPGNRPSNTIMYQRMDPQGLGRILALYEHKVFVQGAIWGINSFDQWGVELGKELASRLIPILQGHQPSDGLDASTAGLMQKLALLRS